MIRINMIKIEMHETARKNAGLKKIKFLSISVSMRNSGIFLHFPVIIS